MAEAYKICPICNASNPGSATICWNCGTTLREVEIYTSPRKAINKIPGGNYLFRYGETDLYENEVYAVGQRYIYGCFGMLTALMLFGLIMFIGPSALDTITSIQIKTNDSSTTNTPIPQIVYPTVTPAPPTPTRTLSPTPTLTLTPVPTPEPCIQTVGPGEGLYAVVLRCGHRSPDVIDLVVEINNLSSANAVREGQTIIVPYPTSANPPTESPADNSSAVLPTTEGDVAVSSSINSAFDENFDPEFFPTATLPPGIAWHTIQTGEDMISIIAQYDASVQVLSELNPELTFSQCEFGIQFGGPRCSVLLIAGQQIRVPVPLPTATLSPTPSGSETPTPTPTPTFNAPTILSPASGTFFERNELITLRWVPSGTLATDEVYRVIVEDRTSQIVYTADTQNTSFVIPIEWQGTDAEVNPRHEFVWRVSVININMPDTPLFTTPTATFTWESSE
ncbi:MAG: hypothetical protein Kow00117_12410 [Phototrophicales bacterium]